MNRRNFLQCSALPLLALLNCQTKNTSQKSKKHFLIAIQSDMAVGHLILQSHNFSKKNIIKKEIFILGGGIAGMTAAYQCRKKDFVLCELSDNLGGSSSALQFKGESFAQGAHYDLTYPHYFGEDVLQMLEGLQLIQFNPISHYWDFKDPQYLIEDAIEGQSWVDGKFRNDVLEENPLTLKFLDLMSLSVGKMKAPTRLIDKNLHYLNQITFYDYLKSKITLDKNLLRSIDYQLLDDYGGTSKEVSALAGTYYYASRPYLGEHNTVFSPPQGNFYFIEKMLAHIPKENILTKHLVRSIEKTKTGFLVQVIDVATQAIQPFAVKQIIYAGQKHALKYIFPKDAHLFAQNQTVPWLVMNFIVKKTILPKGFWQNEIITKDKTFLGFVDNDAQFGTQKDFSVLTAYFCFPAAYRKTLAEMKDFDDLVDYTLQQISAYFEMDKAILEANIQKVFIKVMGHAMTVPTVNYLLNDKNLLRSEANLMYAGVDNARLPILFEAIDSGIQAARFLL